MQPVATEIADLPETFEVYGLDFSPDGQHLAATAIIDSNEVHVWDWKRKKIIHTLKKPDGSGGSVSDPIRYSPDGKLLVACHTRGAGDTVIRIWNATTGEVLRDIVDHSISSGCSAIGFTPDGKFLVRILYRIPKFSGDLFIVHSTENWQPVWGLRTIPFYPTTLSISPDGKYAAIGGLAFDPATLRPNPTHIQYPIQPQIWIIDLSKRETIKTIDAFPKGEDIYRLAWNPDGIHLAAGSWVGGSAKGPDAVRIFDVWAEKIVANEPAKMAHIYALTYTPDGKYLAESAIDQEGKYLAEKAVDYRIRIWDGGHQNLLQEVHGRASSMAVTRDGRFLAMGGNKRILVFELK